MARPEDQKDGQPLAPDSIQGRTEAAKQGRSPNQAPLPATAFSSNPKDTIITPAMDVITSSAEAYNELTPQSKAMMHLGFHQPHKDFETIELGEKRLIAITADDRTLEAISKEIAESGLGLPLNTPVIRGSDSATRTRLFLIPTIHNSSAIAKKAIDSGLKVALAVSNDTAEVARVGDQILPIDPSILAQTNRAGVSTISIVNWQNGNPTPQRKLSTEPIQILGEPKFDSKHIRDNSHELAQKPEKLNNGLDQCTYLIIDLPSLLKDPQKKPAVDKILANLASLAISEDFCISLDQDGHLLLINRSQRSGSRIAVIASDIEKSTGGKVNMLVGEGSFSKENQKFDMSNYPAASTLAAWKKESANDPRTRITAETETAILGRDSTTAEFQTEDTTGSEFLILKDVKRRAKLRHGGPDRYIGDKKDLEKAQKAAHPTSPTRLMIINGGAGSGKSRLADEILKDYPNALVHSIDASGENIPGAALADLVVAISNTLEAKIPEEKKAKLAGTLEYLKSFADKSEDQRIEEAKRPQKLVEMCLRGLKVLEDTCGKFIFTLDDAHHMDSHSEPHITTLIEQFLAQSKSKVLLMRRPEEIYHSQHQKNLATNIRQQHGKNNGENPVEIINLEEDKDGKKVPKLNIHDQEIAKEYAFHSLPEALRMNNELNPPIARDLGTWPQELAMRCKTPFDFTSLLNSLIEDPQKYFDIGSDTISLSQAALEELTAHKDNLSYHQNRVRKLKGPARGILQSIAILGSKLTIQNIIAIAKDIQGVEGAAVNQAIEDLKQGGYLLIDDDGKLAIQHDDYKNIALSALTKAEKPKLILNLYQRFKKEPNIHNDRLFGLLAEVSDNAAISGPNKPFWDEYMARANQSFDEAEKENAYGRGYSIAMTILGDTKERGTTSLGMALDKLEKGGADTQKVPPQIKNLLTKALFAKVKNGLNLGQLQKVTEAIGSLEKVGADNLLTEAYLYGFRAAYVQLDTEAMKKYFAEATKRPDLSVKDRLYMAIRLNFTKARTKKDFDRLLQTIELSPEAVGAEFARLTESIKYEKIRLHLENDLKVDSDVVLNPGHLRAEETAEFEAIYQNLNTMNQERLQDPDKFDAIQTLQLLGQLAELKAFLGDYQGASSDFSEVWRLAQQKQIPTAALRAAKIKGDIEIMLAVSQVEKTPTGREAKSIHDGQIIRKNALKAIQTYTENGYNVLEKVESTNSYQLLIRGQRLRGISTMILSYENEIAASEDLDEIKTALIPHLKTAIADFKFINQSPEWKGIFTNPGSEEYSYYLTSSMGHVLQAIEDLKTDERELGIEIPNVLDPTNYPGFATTNLYGALDHSNPMQDNVGEVDMRKIPGLAKVINLGGRSAIKAGTEPRISQFKALKIKHSQIVEQRAA